MNIVDEVFMMRFLKRIEIFYLKRDSEPKLKTQSIDSSFIANKQGTKNNDYLLSDKEKQKNIKIRQDNLLLPKNQQK